MLSRDEGQLDSGIEAHVSLKRVSDKFGDSRNLSKDSFFVKYNCNHPFSQARPNHSHQDEGEQTRKCAMPDDGFGDSCFAISGLVVESWSDQMHLGTKCGEGCRANTSFRLHLGNSCRCAL